MPQPGESVGPFKKVRKIVIPRTINKLGFISTGGDNLNSI
jgi:hypothetical protein